MYINVDSESYFTQDGNFLNTEAQAHNDLISRIIKAHGENASAYTVLCTDNNADYDITDTERLMLSLSGNQPWPVREGDKIGRFNAGEIGFETVLKSMDFPFTLTDAKAANPAIAKDGDSDKEAERRSLMFEDPAVLFPKHKDKFAYGNYVYLDIRIADGLPYRHAYEVPETTLTEDSNGWPIVRCLPQNNKVDFGIKVLNEEVTGAAVAVRGADSLAGNRDSAVVKWIKDLEAGNDGLSRISIGVEAPRRVQIKILPEANENSSADFVHKHPLDMVFGDYVENIEKVKKMAGIENGSGMRKLMRAQAAPQQETTGIYMLPIAQRETYINYYNDDTALLKADVIIEKFIDKDGVLRTNRLYHATIEHVGESKKRIKSTVDDFLPRILNTAENGSFFKLYNKKHKEHSILKNMDGLLQYLNQENWESPDLFLCMTEEEAKIFDSEIPQDKKGASTSFNFKKKDGANGVYELSQTTEFNDNSIPHETTIKVFTTSDEKIFATKAYLDSSDLDISLPEIHFRRMENEVYDFGFDWMRDGRFDKSTSEKPYIKKNGKKGIFNGDTKALKDVYNRFNINSQTYYVPWLNLSKKGKEAQLKIETFNINDKNKNIPLKINVPKGIKIKIGNEEIGGEENDVEKNIELNSLLNAGSITINCLELSDKDRTLKILTVSQSDSSIGEELKIGQLNIYKNQRAIDLCLNSYKITFIGKITNKNSSIEISKESIEYKNFGSGYQQPTNTEEWRNLMNDYIEPCKTLLSQCSINNLSIIDCGEIIFHFNYDIPSKNASVNVTYTDVNGSKHELSDKIAQRLNPFKWVEELYGDGNNINLKVTSTDQFIKCIILTCNKLINYNTISDPKKLLYLLPIEIVNMSTLNNMFIIAKAIDNFICYFGNPQKSNQTTLAHEIGHIYGLSHSFEKKDKGNVITFSKYYTENIMDYSDDTNPNVLNDKKSFWKWQWDIILNKK